MGTKYEIVSSDDLGIERYRFEYGGTSFLIRVYTEGRKWIDMEIMEPENFDGDESEVFDALEKIVE